MRRFWCPPDAGFALDTRGYLLDPSSSHWLMPQSNSLVETTDLYQSRCLILLGEPGIGKSTVLKKHSPVLHQSVRATVVSANLSSYSEGRLIREIFERPDVIAWATGTGELCLVLDGFDEGLAHIPQMANMFDDYLRSWPTDRMWVRIACRSAHWPGLLASTMRAIFGPDYAEYELLPLRRTDVAELAAEWTDSEQFLTAAEEARLVPLISRPLTCRLLARSFESFGGSLPATTADLYEKGLHALCDENSERRRAAGLLGNVPAGYRLSVAGRLAAATVLAGKPLFFTGPSYEGPGESQCTVEELSGGCESVQGDPKDVTTEAVREVLQSSLFTSRGNQLLGWAHATFADFLAARWMHLSQLSDSQLRPLLLAGDGRLFPQVRLAAAWLVAMAPSKYRWIALADPESFTGEVELPGDSLREAVVEGLLAAPRRVIQEFGRNYSGLKHPGIGEQLRKGMSSSDEDVRRIAIRIGRDCEAEDLYSVLVHTALDVAETDRIRVAASYACLDLQKAQAANDLLPLVVSAALRGEDKSDELIGIGLRACWPMRLTAPEVFSIIKLPKRRIFFGAYQSFLDDFAEALQSPDVVPAVEWLRAGGSSEGEPFRRLRNAVVRLALQNLDDRAVLEAMVDVIRSRATNYSPLIEIEPGDDAQPDPLEDDRGRHALVTALMEMPPSDEMLYWISDLSYATRHVLRPEDLPWIAQQCASVPADRREPWFKLFGMAYVESNRAHLDLVLSMSEDHPLYTAVVADWVRPIQIDSPEAAAMRSQLDRARRFRVPDPPQSDSFDTRISELITECEAGKLPAFWQAARMFYVRRGSDVTDNEHDPDMTKLLRWVDAPDELKERVLRVAVEYLHSRGCNPQEWLGKGLIHYPSCAAYRALVLLLKLRPESLESLTPEDWREWSPIIATWTVTLNGATEEHKRALIERALPHARSELESALATDIAGNAERGRQSFVAVEASLLWTQAFGDQLEELYRSQPSDDVRSELIELMLTNDRPRARHILLNQLADSGISEDRHRARLALQLLLSRDMDGVFDRFMELAESDADFARDALTSRESYYPLTIPDRDPFFLARLFVWLMQIFPPAENDDSDDDDFGLRDDVAQWRNLALDRIAKSGKPEAVAAIRYIGSLFPDERWIDRVEAAAQEEIRRAEWRETPLAELRRLARTATRDSFGTLATFNQ
ncbi:hypothetical protein AB0I92_19520 [Micromonospora chalcea]|uniref:NACHT domain-containing protein n=1 Tax=Micromonospora chalcea TaxID=1874 RepID=UPI0033E48C0E